MNIQISQNPDEYSTKFDLGCAALLNTLAPP